MGKTLSKIKHEIKGRELSCHNIKKHMKYFDVPAEEAWRLEFVEEVLAIVSKVKNIENFSDEDAKLMLGALCTT